jgi:RNA polymerase sigma factor (TIGR02999 family)
MTSQQILVGELEAVGNQTVRDELMVTVYQELRRLAESYLRQERPFHTLQPTALVHEAYLRITEQENISWQNREHFVGIAATMMRRILVNHAIKRNSEKRGGGEIKISLAEADRFVKDEDVNLIALDEALEKLSKTYPQESRIVELRFFGGLTIEQTSLVLGISSRTVERSWRFARIWLLREMSGEQK